MPSASSIGSADESFALRITRWYHNDPLRGLLIFSQGLAAGLLIVLICLLLST